MNKEELEEIMTNGLDRLSMPIADDALNEIVSLAKGLPYFVHLLGLHTVRRALDNNERKITTEYARIRSISTCFYRVHWQKLMTLGISQLRLSLIRENQCTIDAASHKGEMPSEDEMMTPTQKKGSLREFRIDLVGRRREDGSLFVTSSNMTSQLQQFGQIKISDDAPNAQ